MTEETMENLDASIQDEDSTEDVIEDALEEDSEEESDEVEKLRTSYENQKGRAEKAEKALKELKELKELKAAKTRESSKPEEKEDIVPTGLSREEAILFAKDFSIDEVEKVKKIASLDDIGLLEASESEIYKAWSESDKKRRENESAELDASSGSPRKKKTKGYVDISTAEEHKQLWEKSMGQ